MAVTAAAAQPTKSDEPPNTLGARNLAAIARARTMNATNQFTRVSDKGASVKLRAMAKVAAAAMLTFTAVLAACKSPDRAPERGPEMQRSDKTN